MTEKEYENLADEIQHKVRGLVDDHPLTCKLREVERRNMAYAAGHAAVGALTADALKAQIWT